MRGLGVSATTQEEKKRSEPSRGPHSRPSLAASTLSCPGQRVCCAVIVECKTQKTVSQDGDATGASCAARTLNRSDSLLKLLLQPFLQGKELR